MISRRSNWPLSLLTCILTVWAIFLKSPLPVSAQSLTSFSFDNFYQGSSKIAGLPFAVSITARDEFNNVLSSFNQPVSLTDNTGSLTPAQTANFINGLWQGYVYVTQATTGNVVTATYNSVSDVSGSFNVVADQRIKFLTIISGNNQSAVVGSTLPNSLTLRVVDSFGNALPNIGVNFALSGIPPNSTNQSLSNYSATSNSSGQASTVLTFGRKAGTYIVTGTLTSGITNAAHFYENASAGILMSLSLTPAVGIVPANSYLPFTIKGFDQYANEISPGSVSWSVQNGGGTIDGNGIFQAGSTLGTYSNTVRASVGSIGTTGTVTVVGAAGEAGGTATSAGVTLPTPIPSLTPLPTPTLPPGVLYDVQVDPSVISALANARIPILAEGVDALGAPASGVTYDFQSTGTLGTLIQTGPATALLTTTAGGIGTVTVTATQGNITRSTTIAGSVGNGLNRRLVIEEVPSPQAVGNPFTISIAAKDAENNFITDYDGPIVLADTTGTIDPAVVQPNEQGIWYVQVVISFSHPEVSITAAGDGMVGVSNIFAVEGEPKKSLGIPGMGGLAGEGAGDVLGASISGILDKLLLEKDLNKFSIFRYLGSGLAAGLGILGVAIGGGIMISRALEALGRNPYAKGKLQFNLYASLVAFIVVATLAVVASYLILQ